MPEPISIAFGLYAGFTALNGFRRNDSAYSMDGKSAGTAVAEVLRSAENSQALFGAKSVALSALRELTEECSVDDWDGNGSVGIDPFALWNAEEFVRAMPNNLPLPEFSAEPDGSISLDWITSRYRVFSLSIGASNRLSYAWLDGTDKGHGVAQFDSETVPPRILTEIQPIVNNGKITIRSV